MAAAPQRAITCRFSVAPTAAKPSSALSGCSCIHLCGKRHGGQATLRLFLFGAAKLCVAAAFPERPLPYCAISCESSMLATHAATTIDSPDSFSQEREAPSLHLVPQPMDRDDGVGHHHVKRGRVDGRAVLEWLQLQGERS